MGEEARDPRRTPEGAIVVRKPAAGWVELTAYSREEYLERIAYFIEALGEKVDAEACEDIRLVVNEMVANAFEWGNRADPRRRIHVSYGIFSDEVVFKIEDEGDGFVPDEVPDPTASPSEVARERQAAGKRLGGFGLHVAKKLMDEVYFNERGNVVVLTKSIRSPAPARRGKDEVEGTDRREGESAAGTRQRMA